eukprot:scaffold22653_cov119-Cylindrotheca_fusiformis.AAC.20
MTRIPTVVTLGGKRRRDEGSVGADESGSPELGTKSVAFSLDEPHDPKSDLHDPKGQGIILDDLSSHL